MIVLSRFRFFVTFVVSLMTNCSFLSVLLIRLQNEQNHPASCYYFIKITSFNKCYTQINNGVADYSKRQLTTVRFPIQRTLI